MEQLLCWLQQGWQTTQLLLVGGVGWWHFTGMEASTYVCKVWEGRLVGNAHPGGLSESPLRWLESIVVAGGVAECHLIYTEKSLE